MKVNTSPYKIGCQKCRKMVDFYIETADSLLCFKCWRNKIRLETKNNTSRKKSNKFSRLGKKRDTSIYAISGVTSVICSGTF